MTRGYCRQNEVVVINIDLRLRGYQKVCVWGHNLEIEEND